MNRMQANRLTCALVATALVLPAAAATPATATTSKAAPRVADAEDAVARNVADRFELDYAAPSADCERMTRTEFSCFFRVFQRGCHRTGDATASKGARRWRVRLFNITRWSEDTC